MELYELRKQPHLSASAINDYLDCGLLFKFGRIDKIQQEFKSDALEFGSAIHKALADFHKEKLAGNWLTTKELHDCFEAHWRRIAAILRAVKSNILSISIINFNPIAASFQWRNSRHDARFSSNIL